MTRMHRMVLLAAVALAGCPKDSGSLELDDITEVAHMVGDQLASADEISGQEGGAYALWRAGASGRFDTVFDKIGRALLPEAHAASCYGTNTFSACSGREVVRTFSSCSVGSATLNGTVLLTWTGNANCRLDADGEQVTRVPNFTLTGPRGGTLSVGGEGQRLTRTGASTFTFTSLGIQRVARTAAGTLLFDIRSRTLEDITVTGVSRATRSMDGGSLEISHPRAGYVTTLTPHAVTWTADCVCPTSGSMTGTVTKDATHQDIGVQFTGCGTAILTTGDESHDVTMDRCGATH